MNHNEIEACVIGAKNGNHQDMAKILEQYKPFIFKTARQYNLKNYDINDLTQICYIALIKSVSKYSPGSNTFSPYAYRTIKNALKYTARKNMKYHDDFSLNDSINTTEDSQIEYIDCLKSADNLEDEILRSEKSNEIKKVLSKLPSDEKDLVTMIFYNQCSIKTYAEKNDLNYLQAVRKKNRVLKKLNNNLLN